MRESPYSVSLSMGNSGKGIPYAGQPEPRADGNQNHGFKNIKQDLSLLSAIPEIQNNPALYDLVSAINQPSTGLFSIGCIGDPIHDENGHRFTGYIEFAINSVEGISDAGNYFPVFFHFDRMLKDARFEEAVAYHWLLEGATFLDLPERPAGFTATIFINTHYLPTAEEARDRWDQSLEALTYFLGNQPLREGPPLY
ncbi:MAG TPA: hypothetical protein VJM08_03465 [Anaerolineales bacterium]|nr:hypothetical protein [Anaerolineales bacterium]